MLLMLLVSSCGDDYKEKIQGKWYTDFTEEADAGMSMLMILDFSEKFVNLGMDMPDVVTVDTKGTYDIVGNVITPNLENSKSEITMSPKIEEMLRGMGADEAAISEAKEAMTTQFRAEAGETPFSDMGDLTIVEVTDSKLVLESEKGQKLTFTREKPLVKSALPVFKEEIGL